MFSQAIFFRLPANIAESLRELESELSECQLKPVGPLERASIGFVSPFGHGEQALTHQVGRCILLAVGHEERVLPPAAVDQRVAEKVSELEAREGRSVGMKTRRRIKEDVVTEMLPQAFKKRSRTDGYIDLGRSLLVVATSSRKTAENFAGQIRRALGSFPAVPVNAERSPISVLTHWLGEKAELPAQFALGDECVLKAPSGDDTAKLQKHDLASTEVANHLEAGKLCHRIGIVYHDRVSAVIDEKLVLRKVKLLDLALEKLDGVERESLRDEIDARFALFTGEAGALIDGLFQSMSVTPAEVPKSALPEAKAA